MVAHGNFPASKLEPFTIRTSICTSVNLHITRMMAPDVKYETVYITCS